MRVPERSIGKHVWMAFAGDVGELLRARGLRVTPQRRAILGAFSNAEAEHLSADEIHARAAAVVPELGRGTVYAALAELTELGILVARGSPEPVRYEVNTAPHQHFRCRLCLRLFDAEIPAPATGGLASEGFVVEEVTMTAQGVCAECVEYDRGLRAGAKRARSRPSSDLPAGVAAATTETPVGTLTLGATADGMVRVAFDSHADVPALRDVIRSRRGGLAARGHIEAAMSAMAEYFDGHAMGDCAIDWDSLAGAQTLRAAQAVPRGQQASYAVLDTPAGPAERGRVIGSNPVAILIPCHRVTRGAELPGEYVGGAEQRAALLELERSQG
jgi:Fe2+ or Zn2+ uptake regulation protein/O6-methylguanine-DNA--protein-cysteine methyltransferase